MTLQYFLVAHEARPVLTFFDFLDVSVRKVRADALATEDELARRTAEHIATLAAPSAIALLAVLVFPEFVSVLKGKKILKAFGNCMILILT